MNNDDLEELIEHINKEWEKTMENKIYLGDSVYAEFDGFGIELTTNNGYADDPRNVIYLEPSVLRALNLFVEHLEKAQKRA